MIFRHALLCLVFLLSTARGDELGEFVQKWAEREAALGSVRVAFTQEVKNPALREPVSTPGVMWRLDGNDFRWELGVPARTILVRQGGALQLWEAETDKWTALNPNDRRFRNWLSFMGGDGLTAEKLGKDFELSLSSDRSALTLTPKSGMARKHLKHIELQFEPASFHLKRMTVAQADGGMTSMRFSPPERVEEKR